MRIFTATLLIWTAAASVAFGRDNKAPTVARSADPAVLVHGTNQFAAELHDHLLSGAGDLCVSPLGVSTAFLPMYAAARGTTAREMAEVFHLGRNDDGLHRSAAALLRELRGEAGPRGDRVRLGVELWGQPGHIFLKDFLTTVERDYGACLHRVSFDSGTGEAFRAVNAWAAEHTGQRNRDFIPTSRAVKDTRLVVTGAVRFKGSWAAPFPQGESRDIPFRASGQSPTPVPAMSIRGSFGYLESSSFQAVELPCAGGEVSLVVFLPRRPEGLAELEKRLRAKADEDEDRKEAEAKHDSDALEFRAMAAALRGLRTREVRVVLPRFRVAGEVSVVEPLQRMGMERAFLWGAAHFPCVGGRGESLYIEAAAHQAVLQVNEDGVEATAITGIRAAPLKGCQLMGEKVRLQKALERYAVGGSLGTEAVVFRAEHPFLFVLRDRRSGCILVIGRVTHPHPDNSD